MRGAFLNPDVSAVTAPDSINVFLSDRVFSRPSSIIPIGPFNRFADTSSYIVHELFHVAGVPASVIDTQAFQDAIRENCRTLGGARILIK